MWTVSYDLMDKLFKYINDNMLTDTKVGIIMGSGQSRIKEKIKIDKIIEFKNIPGFRNTSVRGHPGEFIIGKYNNTNIICSLGRFHYYEGISNNQITLPIQIFHKIGVRKIIICNSSGCLKEDWSIGDIMYINGCIDYSFQSEKQINITLKKQLNNYKKRQFIKSISKELDFDIKKGTYVWVTGPSYETPAEIDEMVSLGGGAVGMSTYPEIRHAINLGIDVYGLALLTNYASGITDEDLSHLDVVNNANSYIEKLEKTIFRLINHVRKDLNE